MWEKNLYNQINIPLFLTGGTFDLVTPSISEQLGLLLTVSSSPLSRVLLIEGASHFSPIRVEGQMHQLEGKDLFNLGESIVGYHPLSVQSLLAFEIISFLEKLEENKTVPLNTNLTKGELKFHILDSNVIEHEDGVVALYNISGNEFLCVSIGGTWFATSELNTLHSLA